MNIKKNGQFFYLKQASQWVRGTIFQGERLKIAFKMAEASFSSNIMSPGYPWSGLSQGWHSLQAYEEELFVVAIQRAIFYIELLGKDILEYKGIANTIDHSVKLEYIKDIRNMRTHANEYISGKGRDKDRYMFEAPPSYAADATSTIIINGQYLIGGRLDAFAALDIFKSLLPNIERLEIQKWMELSKEDI